MREFIKSLSGHSGCRLYLYKDSDRIFIRKDAGHKDYNNRLKKQFVKQKKFNLKDINTPKIYTYGLNENGVFYFDMEYINGITLSEYMRTIKVKKIVTLINLLFENLPISKNMKIGGGTSQIIFQKKLCALKKNLDKLNISNIYTERALEILQTFDFNKIPYSPCCGDLTLENIIIDSNGRVFLIDLLDSFYNSWMIDIAKLLQDLELSWSYRKDKKVDYDLNLRLAIAKQVLLENLVTLENSNEIISSIYHLLLLNVLRIYPYTKDKDTFYFLDKSVYKVLGIIEDLKKNIKVVNNSINIAQV